MDNIVGSNLKILREANRLTQEKVAGFLGVKRSAYANYEAGEREAPLNVLEAACRLFGCELNTLFEEDEKALQGMLICAFRAEDLCEGDIHEIAAFKNVVIHYMKMKSLLENE